MKGFKRKKIYLLFFIMSLIATTAIAKKDYSLEKRFASIAEDFINMVGNKRVILNWRGAKPKGFVIYYNQQLEPSVLCFEVEKKNKNLGFIMVSSDGIIQEFSTLRPPHKWNIEPLRERAEGCINKEEKLGNPRFIWLGISLYLVRFPVIENNRTTGKITIDMRTNKIIDSMLSPYLKQISLNPKQSPLNTPIISKIIPFPTYRLYISDITTSISSLLAYYQRKGIINLDSSFEKIADKFSKAGCDCEPIKTTKRLLKSYGYSAQGQIFPYSFKCLKDEIDRKRLAVLTVEAGGIKHSLLARGYLKTDAGCWLLLNDQLPEEGTDNLSKGLSFYCIEEDRYSKLNLMTLRITKG
ncbi:MAG: hypothetical protein AB1630_03750 [bacterium]